MHSVSPYRSVIAWSRRFVEVVVLGWCWGQQFPLARSVVRCDGQEPVESPRTWSQSSRCPHTRSCAVSISAMSSPEAPTAHPPGHRCPSSRGVMDDDLGPIPEGEGSVEHLPARQLGAQKQHPHPLPEVARPCGLRLRALEQGAAALLALVDRGTQASSGRRTPC